MRKDIFDKVGDRAGGGRAGSGMQVRWTGDESIDEIGMCGK